MSVKPELQLSRSQDGGLLLQLRGDWCLRAGLPQAAEVRQALDAGQVAHLGFAAEDLAGWDSGLLTFLVEIAKACAAHGIPVDRGGLPGGVQRLLALAAAVPERVDARKTDVRRGTLENLGEWTLDKIGQGGAMLTFLGDACLALGRLLTGRARVRSSDLFRAMQQCGSASLPIVTLISFLVGMIVAFMGAVQLKLFGAEIFVASLVGIAMLRVMGALMVGIIMAGRVGAAFAAELGTMQVNEEIDALETLAIPSMEFLVVPRLIALTIMMPLLCLYADFLGVLGGCFIGVFMLDLGLSEYYHQTVTTVGLTHLWIGLFTSAVFGVLIALAGCFKGITCGRSASAVGQATTAAVVMAIVSIVVATSVITVMCDFLGI